LITILKFDFFSFYHTEEDEYSFLNGRDIMKDKYPNMLVWKSSSTICQNEKISRRNRRKSSAGSMPWCSKTEPFQAGKKKSSQWPWPMRQSARTARYPYEKSESGRRGLGRIGGSGF